MIKILSSYGDIIKIVRLANRLSDQRPEGTNKYGFLLTNRSFLVPVFGMLLNILILFNAPFLAPVLDLLQNVSPEIAAEQVILIVTGISFLWSFIERQLTDAKPVLTRNQAEQAVVKVVGDDKLAKSLIKAVTVK